MEHSWEEFIEASDTAIIGRSADGTILSWNLGAERLYGYTADEIIGRSISVLSPADRQDECAAIMTRVAGTERAETMEAVRVAKDGRHIPVSLLFVPTRDRSGRINGLLTVARDLSPELDARRRLDEARAATEQRAVVLETANRVALDILANRTGIEALRHIAEAARMLSGAQYAALGVARADGNGLQEFVTTGLSEEKEATMGPRPTGRGVLGLLLQRTEPLRIDNLGSHPASVGYPSNHPVMTSFLGVPIRRADHVLGSLYLTNKLGADSFTAEDEVAVQALGAHAAVAIHNMQMLLRQRMLVQGLITAQEEERKAVAYDLHDGLTQYVMASHAHLESFRRAQAAGKAEKAARDLDQGMRYLKEAVMESRRMVNGLRSLALDDLGLAGAVEQLLHEEKERAGWTDANLMHNVADRRFDHTVETAAYRVIQEALTNARKHAATESVQVLILAAENPRNGSPELRVEVQDWGRGFVPEEKSGDYAHFGLQGMAERVALIGGEQAIESAPGAGTVVRATLPALEPQPEPDDPAENTGREDGA
jgi:PAS domain S-box-containing protein